MREPSHPWRIELAATVEGLIKDLATDPQLRARGEELKRRLLDSPAVNRQIDALWRAIEARLNSASTSRQLTDTLEQLLIKFGSRLASDEQLASTINRWLRVAGLRVIAPRRAEIAAFIRKVVETWDTETLVTRIELQIGPDLQYIRINGTLVGGLVGLAIFALAQRFALL
jgi:uncharacterized membrane-anchored protein YjiN (DUF445 family)